MPPIPPKAISTANQGSRAFTLVELLTVIAIVAVLAGLTLSGLGQIRASARTSKCTNNLRQIGAAFQLYAADNRGLYPAARYRESAAAANKNPSGDNWQREISRYLTLDSSVGDIKKAGEAINVAHCPSYDRLFPDLAALIDTPYKAAGYGMNVNISGVPVNSAYDTRFPVATISTPAATVLVGDSADYHIDIKGATWPLDPNNPNRPDGYASGAPTRHEGSANYLFCDGHVVRLQPDKALVVVRYKP